jgi:hypothetical protein
MNYGNFSNPKDGYHANPKSAPTYLTGVPLHENEPKNYNGSIIFFVNGHWNYFNPGNLFAKFISKSITYFGLKSTVDIKFIDGSSLYGGDQSGSDRKALGYLYAKSYFEKYKTILSTNTLYFVSHSEGCAYGIGMAKFFTENGVTVKESILLACDEGDEFEIDFTHDSYQIELMYWNVHYPPYNPKPKPFYNTNFDMVINTILKDGGVKGIKRFGVVCIGVEGKISVETSKVFKPKNVSIHGGSIVDEKSFDRINSLKKVYIESTSDSKGNKVVRQYNSPDIIFYQVDKEVLNENNPNLQFA